MEQKEIDKLYQRVSVLFQIKPENINPAGLAEWYRMMKPYRYKTMDTALTEYAEKKSFPPKPGELIKLYKENRQDKQRKREFVQRGPDGEPLYNCPYCCDTGFTCVDQSHKGLGPIAVKCHCRSGLPDMELRKRQATGYVYRFGEGSRGYWYKPMPERELWVGEAEQLATGIERVKPMGAVGKEAVKNALQD